MKVCLKRFAPLLGLALMGVASGGPAIRAEGEEKKGDGPWGGYDSKKGGFFLQSPDGKFLLTLSMRMQVRYTYFGKDRQGEDDPGDPGDATDESYFELERARIGFNGHLFDPKLIYRIEIDSDSDGSDKGVLTDAYLQYRHREFAALGMGQFKPYFLRQEATSWARQQRVERSLSNEFFNLDRSIGVWVEGYPLKWLFYNLAVTNGIDATNVGSGGGATQVLDQRPACVAKLDFTLMGDHRYSYEESDLRNLQSPLLVLGASFAHESWEPSQVDTTSFIATRGKVYTFGVDCAFKYRGFSLTSDYVGRWYDQDGAAPAAFASDSPTSEALFAHGFNLQGGFFVWRNPDIELTARVSSIWGNEGAEDGKAVEVGPGVNWFFGRSHNGKLQLDVAWVDISNDLPSNTELLRQGPDAPFGSTPAGFAEGEQGLLVRVQVQLAF